MKFSELNLEDSVLDALDAMNFFYRPESVSPSCMNKALMP